MAKPKKVKKKWGWYKVLFEGKGYKIKKLCLSPNKETPLQRHSLRREVWIPLDGGEIKIIEKNEWHKLNNKSPKAFMLIEVQSGWCRERDLEKSEG